MLLINEQGFKTLMFQGQHSEIPIKILLLFQLIVVYDLETTCNRYAIQIQSFF